MKYLKLSNGTIWEDGYLIRVETRIFLYIPGGDMKTVFDQLIDPANTAAISYKDGPDEQVFEGFTRLTAVNDEGDRMVTAVLRKEAA